MNRKVLTIKKIKNVNRTSGIVGFFIMGFLSIFIIIGILTFIDTLKREQALGISIIGPLMFVGIPLLTGGVIIKNTIRNMRENKLIDNGEFKIIEDVIYRRHTYTTRDNDGHTTHHYEFYTNLHGRVSTDSKSYHRAQRGDLIYLVVYNDKDVADQGYLLSLYELSDELRPYFVSYEEESKNHDINRRIDGQYRSEENTNNMWWDE